MGNILKYAQRYGKKNGRNKADLMKVIHYAIIQLSLDHYKDGPESLDNLTAPELKPGSEKYNQFKSIILDDLLNKQENLDWKQVEKNS